MDCALDGRRHGHYHDRVIDLQRAVATLRERQRALDEAASARADELRARLPGLVALLRLQFAATRVVLFGSLARGEFAERSDVDLAVAGIASSHYWRALDVVCHTLGTEQVDLVRLEEATPEMCETLKYEGIEL